MILARRIVVAGLSRSSNRPDPGSLSQLSSNAEAVRPGERCFDTPDPLMQPVPEVFSFGAIPGSAVTPVATVVCTLKLSAVACPRRNRGVGNTGEREVRIAAHAVPPVNTPDTTEVRRLTLALCIEDAIRSE